MNDVTAPQQTRDKSRDVSGSRSEAGDKTKKARYTILLEQISKEFKKETHRLNEVEHNLNRQLQEIQMMLQSIDQLKGFNVRSEQIYEDEIETLRDHLNRTKVCSVKLTNAMIPVHFLIMHLLKKHIINRVVQLKRAY